MNGQMMIPQQIVPGMPPQMLDKPPPGAAPYMSYFPPPIPQMPPIPQAAASTASEFQTNIEKLQYVTKFKKKIIFELLKLKKSIFFS